MLKYGFHSVCVCVSFSFFKYVFPKFDFFSVFCVMLHFFRAYFWGTGRLTVCFVCYLTLVVEVARGIFFFKFFNCFENLNARDADEHVVMWLLISSSVDYTPASWVACRHFLFPLNSFPSFFSSFFSFSQFLFHWVRTIHTLFARNNGISSWRECACACLWVLVFVS